MTRDPILKVNGLSKAFCRDPKLNQFYGLCDIVGEVIPWKRGSTQLRRGEFWVIDNMTFSLHAGEALAVMGRNGAGKTTLLRIISGLLKPDRGSVSIDGSVNSVMELGYGLDPLLSGKENTVLGLAWRGISTQQIRGLIHQIADFSELGDMFHNPVQNYSAGMKLRLAYSIAAFVPCKLLLLDEILAVGDVAFQQKCLRHIQGHLNDGGAVVLVSHDVVQMQHICRRGILLDRGRMIYDDTIQECVTEMLDVQKAEDNQYVVQKPDLANESATGLHIQSVIVSSLSESAEIMPGDDIAIDVFFYASHTLRAVFAVSILTSDLSLPIAHIVDVEAMLLGKGEGCRRCTLPNFPLAPGLYSLRTVILDPETYHPIAHVGVETRPTILKVVGNGTLVSLMAQDQGQLIVLDHNWS